MSDSNPPRLWDKRADENDTQYNRFQFYLGLGPARTLDAAYAAFVATAPKRTKTSTSKKESIRANGTWKEDSGKFDWEKRASAWDVYIFSKVEDSVVIHFTSILKAVTAKMMVALTEARIKPRSWDVLMESIQIIGNYIPPDALAEIRNQSQEQNTLPPH